MLGRKPTILAGIPQKVDTESSVHVRKDGTDTSPNDKVWGLGQIPGQSGHLISHFGGVEKGNQLENWVSVLTLAGSRKGPLAAS